MSTANPGGGEEDKLAELRQTLRASHRHLERRQTTTLSLSSGCWALRAVLPEGRLHLVWLEEAGEDPARWPTRCERRGALREEMRRRLADSPLARLDGCPAIAEIREWVARQSPADAGAAEIREWLRRLPGGRL